MKTTRIVLTAVALSLFAFMGTALAQITCVQSSSLFTARDTGITETVGDLIMLCTTPIPAGTFLSLQYTAAITNEPPCPEIEGLICDQQERGIQMYFGKRVARPILRFRGVRLDATSVEPGRTIIEATLEFDTSANGVSPLRIPVAILQPGLEITAGPPLMFVQSQGGAGEFCIQVTKGFPSAFTTRQQETSLSNTPPADNGTQIRVVFGGVPRGVRITSPSEVRRAAFILERISQAVREGPGDLDFLYETVGSDLGQGGAADMCFTVEAEANQYEDGAGIATVQAQLYPEPGPIVSFLHPLQNDPPDEAIRILRRKD